MKLLITFGCSWTYGVGVNYTSGMDKESFRAYAWNKGLCDRYSFRGLLSEKFDFTNINFSRGGASNDQQFRLAENFFNSFDFKQFQQQYSKIFVLWGITSILRKEAYFNDISARKSFFLTRPDDKLLPKILLADHFDLHDEISILGKKIQFWDSIFDLLKVNNIWFDTFNHHDYNIIPEQIEQKYLAFAGESWPTWEQFKTSNLQDVPNEVMNEILDSTRWEFYKYHYSTSPRMFGRVLDNRDLLSRLAIANGMNSIDNNYHVSDWKNDASRISYLQKLGLLNPFSYHPTKQAHEQIANMLSNCYGNLWNSV